MAAVSAEFNPISGNTNLLVNEAVNLPTHIFSPQADGPILQSPNHSDDND